MSLHPVVQVDVGKVNLGGNPVIDSILSYLLSNAAHDKLGNYESRNALNNWTRLSQFRGPRLKSTNQNTPDIGPGIVPPSDPACSL